MPFLRGPISASLDLSLSSNNARIDFFRRDVSFTVAFAIDNIIYTEHVVYAPVEDEESVYWPTLYVYIDILIRTFKKGRHL